MMDSKINSKRIRTLETNTKEDHHNKHSQREEMTMFIFYIPSNQG